MFKLIKKHYSQIPNSYLSRNSFLAALANVIINFELLRGTCRKEYAMNLSKAIALATIGE